MDKKFDGIPGEYFNLQLQLQSSNERAENAEVLRLCKTLEYIAGIVERGENRKLAKDEPIDIAVLNYVKQLEQQNADLRAQIEQKEADCAGYRAALEHYASIKEAYMPIKDSKIPVIVQGKYQMIYGTTAQQALSTSSGKDMLELVKAVGEGLELIGKLKMKVCAVDQEQLDKVYEGYKLIYDALAKLKGHKNEWGEW